jgi:hypothetical protein
MSSLVFTFPANDELEDERFRAAPDVDFAVVGTLGARRWE